MKNYYINLINLFKKKDFDAVRFILSCYSDNNSSIDVNETDEDGNSPLLLAIMDNQMELILILLLRKDINLNLLNHLGQSALSMAIIYNKMWLVKLLIKKGVNLYTRNLNGETPLFLSTNISNMQLFDMIYNEECSVDTPNLYNQTPLAQASINGELEKVRKIIIKSNNINYCNDDNKSPLFQTLEHLYYLKKNTNSLEFSTDLAEKYKNIIGLLLEQSDIKVNYFSKDKLSSPLSLACEIGDFEIFKNILKKSSEELIYHKYLGGLNIFQIATKNQFTNIVEYLKSTMYTQKLI